MSLNRKQADFTACIGKFIVWAFDHGYQLIGAEWFRTPEQAELYAKQGKGIKNSVHRKKLAVDFFLYKDGNISWNKEDYRPLGDKWKSMDSRARWGGDFKNRDAVHFSFEHNGVK
jgi:hypothetical protein